MNEAVRKFIKSVLQ